MCEIDPERDNWVGGCESKEREIDRVKRKTTRQKTRKNLREWGEGVIEREREQERQIERMKK